MTGDKCGATDHLSGASCTLAVGHPQPHRDKSLYGVEVTFMDPRTRRVIVPHEPDPEEVEQRREAWARIWDELYPVRI